MDEGKAMGRGDMDLMEDNTALVIWMEGGDIIQAKVKKDGTKSPSMTLASSSDSRASGFPQLTISGGRAIAAWTDDKEKIIKTASILL